MSRLTTELAPEQAKQQLEMFIDSINNTLNEYRQLMDTLESRVSKKDKDIVIESYQNYKSIEISENSNYLVLQEKSQNIEDMLSLSSENGDWNFNQIFEYENQTKSLLEDIGVYRNLVDHQAVWMNRSESIYGSCCVMANLSIETGLPIVVDDLIIKKDSDDDYLDGDITWGFISLDDVDRDVSGIVTFDQNIRANTLESPSIDLSNAFLLDHEPMIIRGNLSINKLEMDVVSINYSRPTEYNLMSVVPINGPSPSTLSNLDFDQVKVTDIKDMVVSNINLAHLMDTKTNQTINSTVSVKKVELDGPSLSADDEFVQKLVGRLVEFVNKTDTVKYNKIVIDSMNVTNFYTEAWDEWISLNTSETISFDDLKINGCVNFPETVNDFRWDNLVFADNTDNMEEIESAVVFEDEIAITEGLAYDLFKTNITPTNWVVHGDLNITQELNNRLWDGLLENLIALDGSIEELEFEESVSVKNCDFKLVNGIETVNLATYGNISYPLTFDDLESDELTLDGWNMTSCLTRNCLYENSTENYPIDTLNIISLQLNGTINDIDPTHLLINGSDQDFKSLNGSLSISSNISFELIEIASANIDVKQLNGLELDRLLRDGPERWPKTLILADCNITNLGIPRLKKFVRSALLNKHDQEFHVPINFRGNVTFDGDVKYLGYGSSLRINYDTGRVLSWSNLKIIGNITVYQNVYDMSADTVNISQGLKAEKLIVKNKINSSKGIIYENSTWNVHRNPSNQYVQSISVVDELIIDGDLEVNDQQAVPWLSHNSYNGLEFYSQVELINLTLKISGNCSYNQLKSENGKEIKLDEIIDKSADPLDITLFENVTFDGEVSISGNVTSDNNLNISIFPYDNYNFNLSNSTSATFTDEVMIIGDLN
uniref:Uncharacterized protein n=1 Tax=Tetranychus urticae TaxID=32264 RepID=T1KG37_TETUR